MQATHQTAGTAPRPRQITAAAAQQALDWLMAMQSGELSRSQHDAWQRWRQADGANEAAWQQIERVNQSFGMVPPAAVTLQALDASAQARRRNLKLLGLCATGGMAALIWQQTGGQGGWLTGHDYTSLIGQVQAATLPDGVRITLNTDSALDARYDARQRLLILQRGEVLVQAVPDAQGRPLRIQTAQGWVQAQATRVIVRELPQACQVSVLQGSVVLQPQGNPDSERLLRAGEQSLLFHSHAQAPQPITPHAGAWADGMLVAVDMPLADFLAELSRYRRGVLRCDPAIGQWRISGSYPLVDTDRILAALPSALPVQVVARTRYWISVQPATGEPANR